MVKYKQPALDATFGALADPTRRAILARLARGGSSVTALALPFRMSLPAVSKHLRVLEGAGLVRRERDGRVHHMRLSPRPLQDAAEWIAFYKHFWEAQFSSLETFIEEMKKEDPTWRPLGKKQKSSVSNARFPRHAKKSSRPGRTRR